jgi:hypothetical protein
MDFDYNLNIKGWTYAIKKSKPEIIIKDPNNTSVPRKLYKYYSLSGNSVDAVVEEYFYASHPVQLNDTFDCHFRLIEIDDHECDEIRSKFGLSKVEVEFFEWLKNFKILGIISTTKDPLDLRMWAYYTNNRGFVVEFETSSVPGSLFSGPFPVQYQDNVLRQKISVKDEIKSLPNLLYLLNSKSNVWKDENEWRYIGLKEDMEIPISGFQGGNDRKVSYKGTDLEITAIYFGTLFFLDEKFIENVSENNYNPNALKLKKRLFQFLNKRPEIDLFDVTIDKDTMTLKPDKLGRDVLLRYITE